MEPMTIGQRAGGAGVGVETIRFYERRGLIPEPPRTPSPASISSHIHTLPSVNRANARDAELLG